MSMTHSNYLRERTKHKSRQPTRILLYCIPKVTGSKMMLQEADSETTDWGLARYVLVAIH